EQHRAGAAHSVLAAHMAAREIETLAQEIDQCLACIDALVHGLAIDRERNVVETLAHDRASASCAMTRLSSTPARCFFPGPEACTSPCGSRSAASAATASSPRSSASSAVSARTGVASTPKKARRTSLSAEPSARADAASPTIA